MFVETILERLTITKLVASSYGHTYNTNNMIITKISENSCNLKNIEELISKNIEIAAAGILSKTI
jgi:hypothetical protein